MRDVYDDEQAGVLMTTDHDEKESGGRSPPKEVSCPAEVADERAASAPEPETPACPLADFARRVRACETPWRLDMLHSQMLRTVPVRLRADYITLLNQRDEELSFQYTEVVWRV